MELKDFVKETLINIVEGIKEANEKYKNKFTIAGSYYKPGLIEKGDEGDFVDFDVSVTIDEKNDDETKKGIIIVIGNLLAGYGDNKKKVKGMKILRN